MEGEAETRLSHFFSLFFFRLMTKLTHIDENGRASMVDVGQKPDSERTAIARGAVLMQPETLQLIIEGNVKKGDVLTTAEIAGTMAAKRTSDLIPMCHPLLLTHISVRCTPNREDRKSVV